MSKTKNEKNHSVSYCGFGGIDRTLIHSDKPAADEIVNFRISKDGSLEKRCGYVPFVDLGEPVRAIYSSTEDGKNILYALVGDTVYSVDCDTGEKTKLAIVGTVSGSASFFVYVGKLFLTDHTDLYLIGEESATPVYGYAPLFAKDWGSYVAYDVNEPRNVLNKSARLTYHLDTQTIYLNVKYPVSTVEEVRVNGFPIASDKYRIDNNFCTVNVQDLNVGDKVEIRLTYSEGSGDHKNKLMSAKFCSVFGDSDNPRIFLCGGDAGSKAFVSRYVGEEDILEAEKTYPNSQHLYFPESNVLDVGNGANRIQAITSHKNKILIFTEGDVWITTFEEKDPLIQRVDPDIGCPVLGGAVAVENGSVSLGRHSVWLWTDDPSVVGTCKARSISNQIDKELSHYGLENCGLYYDRTKSELWVYCKTDDIAWIYNFGNGFWYKYEGILADDVFDINGNVAFIKDGYIYVFNESKPYDTNKNGIGRGIIGQYYSSFEDFGYEGKKQLSSLVLKGDLHDDDVTVTFEMTDGATRNYVLRGNDSHSIIKRRIWSGNFKSLRFKLTAAGNSRQTIHGIVLNAR